MEKKNAGDIVLIYANPTLNTGIPAKAKIIEILKDYGNDKN